MDVGGCPALVNRITYTGDLGYEIWMEPAYQRTLYLAIKAAGEAEGIVDFGMRALLSMRLEKNFPTWFGELRPIYGPVRGRHGPLRQAREERLHRPRRPPRARPRTGPRLRRVSLVVEAEDADVMGDEPIWARHRPGLRRGRRAARLRRAALRRRGRRDAEAGRPARRRLARRRLGDLGRLRALRRAVDGAGLCAGRPRRARRARACSRSRSSAAAARRGSPSSRPSTRRGEDAGVRTGALHAATAAISLPFNEKILDDLRVGGMVAVQANRLRPLPSDSENRV